MSIYQLIAGSIFLLTLNHPCKAGDENLPTIDSILFQWKKTIEQCENFSCRFETKQIDQKMNSPLILRSTEWKQHGDSAVWETIENGDHFKGNWKAGKLQYDEISQPERGLPRNTLRSNLTKDPFFANYGPWGVNGFYTTFGTRISIIQLLEANRNTTEISQTADGILIRVRDQGKVAEWMVDPKTHFWPRKSNYYLEGISRVKSITEVISFREISTGLFLPEKVIFKTIGLNGSEPVEERSFTEMQIDAPETLTIEPRFVLPKTTSVFDAMKGQTYRTDNIGEVKSSSIRNHPAATPLEEVIETPKPTLNQSESNWLWIVGSVLFLLILIYLFAIRKHRSS